MKWGVHRYQNSDGTLTNAGKKHYSSSNSRRRAMEISRDRVKMSLSDKNATDDERMKLFRDYQKKIDSLRSGEFTDADEDEHNKLMARFEKERYKRELGKGFAESAKNPKQFAKSYAEDVSKIVGEIPKAFLKKLDSNIYRKNIFAKSFQMTKDVYSKSISDSKNPLIKAARDIARDEANRLYSKNGAKLPVLDNFSRFSVNLTSKLVYKKDYLDKLSDREKLELKKEMAYYMLLSNQYD